jgi:hypothetical protein
MTRVSIALVVALPLFTLAGTAPPDVQAQRDVAMRTGSASLGGVVVSRDDGRPIARATVVLGGAGSTGLTTFTDDAGRFVFDGLPGGSFTLSASKASWLTMAFGQSEPGRGSGLPVALKEGESRRDVKWGLQRAGTIRGRVLDVDRQPLRTGVVTLQQRRVVDGETKFVSCCTTARTDANGAYRVTGLLPGEYLVSAVPPGDYRFVGDGPAVYSEGMRQTTDEEVRWALAALKSGAAAAAPPPASEPARSRTVAFGRVYFGGAIDPARASAVLLKPGEERDGVDMTLQLVPTAMIQARAVMPDGQPPANASFVFSDGWSSSGAALPADGRFERRNLAPGRYSLTVRGRGASVSGTRVIDVNGEDLTDIVVAMAPAASLSGRIDFEQGETAPPEVGQVQVLISPVNLLTPARPAPDGRWSLPLVDPGRYRLNPSLPAAARGLWSLKSIVMNGRDVTDTTFDVGSGDSRTDVVITFTTRRTALSGTLLTADGQPAAAFYVVVFSDDPAHWVTGARRVPPPVRASTDGSYQFAGLPPGTYRLAALTHVDQADLADTAFLTALKASAIVVRLAEGESVRQDVRFGK